MALKRSPRPSTTVIALISLVLINVTMTSALPSTHLLRDVRTAKATSMSENPTPKTPDLGGIVACPGRHYFSEGAMACKPCSARCPINQIIRRPCSALADTVCGPFSEFDTFNQSPVEDTPREKETDDEGETGIKEGHIRGADHSPASGSGEEARAGDGRAVSLEKANGQWRTLSYALIVVLSFICCLVVIVGLYVYIILRRSLTQKLIIREPALLSPRPYPEVDSEPRYVETYVTSRDRIKTSRHLPVYQQIFTGCDTSQLPPLTSCGCDAKTDEVVTPVDEGDYLCVYVNTEALDTKDS